MNRVARDRWIPGTRVWLEARTISAPAICYQWPQATLVRLNWPYIVVNVDGQEHEIHNDNVRLTDPRRDDRRPPRRPAPRLAGRPMVLPDGWEEVPLW